MARRLLMASTLVVCSSLIPSGDVHSQSIDYRALAESAKNNFRPIDASAIASARLAVTDRANALEQWVVPTSRRGAGWLHYLHWNDFQRALADADRPDFAPLLATHRRLNQDRPGLELAPFRRLSAALRKYLDAAGAVGLDDQSATLGRQLDALAKDLQQYATAPTPRLEHSIGTRLDFISGLGAAPRLVQTARGQYAKSNAYVEISSGLLAAALSEPFSDIGPVTDCILGTAIRGTANTTGSVTVRPVPSADRAILQFTSTGRITSRNRGYNDPVVIHSTGVTDFTATKHVELLDETFRVTPSAADARTRTRIHSVQAQNRGLFSGLISRVGSRQVHESKHQAEAIASRKAERRVRSEFDEELLDAVKDMRRQYRDEFRLPLKRRDEYPERVQFSSTSDSVSMNFALANRGQLAAPAPPPPAPTGHDLVARIHQTASSNYAAALIGGATLAETSPEDEAEFDVPLPAWLEDALDEIDRDQGEPQPHESTSGDDGPRLTGNGAQQDGSDDFRPWAITLRRSRPVSVRFDDGQIQVTVHAVELKSGNDQFKNWDLIALYDVAPAAGGLELTRDDAIEVLPTGFDPAAGRRLSSRQVGIRSNLNKVINDLAEQGDGFPEALTVPELELSGDLADVGRLRLEQVACDDGWITLAWDR